MARIECSFESDVMAMVYTGQWPGRAPDALRAHVAACPLCTDVVTVAAAIDTEAGAAVEAADPVAQRLPTAGTMWWRAQLRARQDAAREVARPITVAQAVGFAAAVGAAGALFGATSDWFQRAVARMAGGAMETLSRFDFPSWSRSSSAFGPSEAPALLAGYGPVLIVAGFVAVMAMAVVGWVLRED